MNILLYEPIFQVQTVIVNTLIASGFKVYAINHLTDISDSEALSQLRLENPNTDGSRLERMFGFLKSRKKESEMNDNLAETGDLREHTERAQSKLQRITELMVQRRRENSSND